MVQALRPTERARYPTLLVIRLETLEGTMTVMFPIELAEHVNALEDCSPTLLKLPSAHTVHTEAPEEAM